MQKDIDERFDFYSKQRSEGGRYCLKSHACKLLSSAELADNRDFLTYSPKIITHTVKEARSAEKRPDRNTVTAENNKAVEQMQPLLSKFSFCKSKKNRKCEIKYSG